MRTALISAIAACAGDRLQSKARRFLRGLSTDELQYIADFLGACTLEAASIRGELASSVAWFGQVRGATARCLSDQEHKMILLLEYLRRCGPRERTYCNSRIQILR